MSGTPFADWRLCLGALFLATALASCKKTPSKSATGGGAGAPAPAVPTVAELRPEALATANPINPTPVQARAIEAYKLALHAVRKGRQRGKPVPRGLLNPLGLAALGLERVGIDRKMLPDDDVLCPDANNNGLTFGASVCSTVSTSYDAIKSLVYPQFWTPCIRVFACVTFNGDEPAVNTAGAAQINEAVYPLYPGTTYQMNTTLNLSFTVSDEIQQVTFNFVMGDELSGDTGDIIIQSVDDNPADGTIVSIDKTMTFARNDDLAQIFQQNPSVLVTNLQNWLTDTEQECGKAYSTTSPHSR